MLINRRRDQLGKLYEHKRASSTVKHRLQEQLGLPFDD